MTDRNAKNIWSGLSVGLVGLAAGLALASCAKEGTGAAAQKPGDFLEAKAPEVIANGFIWTEGPVWIDDGYLLFSDVPGNVVFKWSQADGFEEFLNPSGFAGPITDDIREAGINGMIKGPDNTIYAADSGVRAIVQVDLATKKKTILADHYDGKRFNSPNDLARASNGDIYFTDPPYGLTGVNESPLKELSFNGVYRLAPDGAVTLVDDSLAMPNGVALSPDEQTLYVSVSNPEGAIWVAYDRAEDGTVSNKRVFFDATERVKAGAAGLPDGMCMAASGALFSSGPGGLYIFADEEAEPVVVDLGDIAENCTFGEDGKTLFVTSNHRVLRLRSRLVGKGF